MQTQRINITLPTDVLTHLRRSVPNRKRSKFIAEAIKDKLPKQDIEKNLRKSAQAQKEIIEELQKDFSYADQEILDRLP